MPEVNIFKIPRNTYHLHRTARRGDIEGISQLVKYFKSNKPEAINSQNEHGETAFILAAINNHANVVSLLLRNSADINQQDMNGDTALMQAVRNRSYDAIVEILACNRTNLDIKNTQGKKALDYAKKDGSIAELFSLTSRTPTESEEITWAQHPSHLSILLRKLFEMRSDGKTALYNAIIQKQSRKVEYLLKARLNPDVINSDENSFLHLALISQTPDKIIKLLCMYMKNVNHVNKDGLSPLLLASTLLNDKAIKRLLRAGANIHEIDRQSNTALMNVLETCSDDSLEAHKAVAYLIAAGIDINAKNKSGKTALMIAASRGLTKVCHLLMAADTIDLRIKDNHHLSAAYYAVKNNHLELADEINKAIFFTPRPTSEPASRPATSSPRFFTRRNSSRLAQQTIAACDAVLNDKKSVLIKGAPPPTVRFK